MLKLFITKSAVDPALDNQLEWRRPDKPTDAIWDVNSLTLASANFPELVAKTPQKTCAILSKYTTLKSFLKIYQPSSVLTYENAGVYTSALLDTYMDYKSIWKQIQVANFELRNRRADIRIGKPSEEVKQLATAKKEVDLKKKQDNAQADSPSQADTVESKRGVATLAPALITDSKGIVTLADPPQPEAGNKDTKTKKEPIASPEIADMIDFEPYPATVMGLDRARRDCRNEMIKIVNEVDCVTTHPELALDLRREKTDNPDSSLNPKSLVILGETNEAPQLQQWLYNRMGNPDSPQPFPAMLASLDRHKTRSKKFDMGDDWCGVVDPGKTALFSNCLDRIDESWIPKSIGIWVADELLIGLKVFYTNGLDIPHGECSGQASGSIDIRDGEASSVIQLTLEAAEPPNSTARVTGLQVTFNTCKNQEYPALGRPVDKHRNRKTTSLSQPTNGFWSFRGFWAATAPYQGGFLALGAVWGLDDALAHSPKLLEGEPTVASGPDYQMFLGRAMPEDALESAQEYRSKAGKFSMSNYIGTAKVEKEKFIYFNDLDRVKESWRIKSVTFYQDDDALTGYIINYFDGEPIQRGRVPSGQLGSEGSKKPQRWVTVELELGEHSTGEAPVICGVTLMDISKERYSCRLRDSVVIGETTISQPDSSWCVAGFWGYYNKELKVLSHLGLVWMNV
ncbi:hypothetical protein FPHYL_6387 [Fusarium phyllophilum]|uniref:Uncharacterized protein n=1 Tax=Fusarium phyllophilum TaxID=47803 RepID=A0A8H5NDJ2_9HYPO|nr:hypothetical protein FPHYL_6387 [Fusarium phyllophilum]